ncbi:hypothetical protein DFA_09149 [Cavenderia fasciculata]|uniref:Transmembrane protein n=1 Tax=Cavenderia fasciculata TaxID=261658 RepID=F4Q6U2_CACFS|nr:uncharacterized protein DFA_09149 [Cavenderia fasciculata]EGG16602.1 hypothetical protein DFA_09149 [Cavenderia fasciculata]|eukprot:XP_004355002.1 hypothetical protein DFA_09149 [Cavenderia fasciculata]
MSKIILIVLGIFIFLLCHISNSPIQAMEYQITMGPTYLPNAPKKYVNNTDFMVQLNWVTKCFYVWNTFNESHKNNAQFSLMPMSFRDDTIFKFVNVNYTIHYTCFDFHCFPNVTGPWPYYYFVIYHPYYQFINSTISWDGIPDRPTQLDMTMTYSNYTNVVYNIDSVVPMRLYSLEHRMSNVSFFCTPSKHKRMLFLMTYLCEHYQIKFCANGDTVVYHLLKQHDIYQNDIRYWIEYIHFNESYIGLYNNSYLWNNKTSYYINNSIIDCQNSMIETINTTLETGSKALLYQSNLTFVSFKVNHGEIHLNHTITFTITNKGYSNSPEMIISNNSKIIFNNVTINNPFPLDIFDSTFFIEGNPVNTKVPFTVNLYGKSILELNDPVVSHHPDIFFNLNDDTVIIFNKRNTDNRPIYPPIKLKGKNGVIFRNDDGFNLTPYYSMTGYPSFTIVSNATLNLVQYIQFVNISLSNSTLNASSAVKFPIYTGIEKNNLINNCSIAYFGGSMIGSNNQIDKLTILHGENENSTMITFFNATIENIQFFTIHKIIQIELKVIIKNSIFEFSNRLEFSNSVNQTNDDSLVISNSTIILSNGLGGNISSLYFEKDSTIVGNGIIDINSTKTIIDAPIGSLVSYSNFSINCVQNINCFNLTLYQFIDSNTTSTFKLNGFENGHFNGTLVIGYFVNSIVLFKNYTVLEFDVKRLLGNETVDYQKVKLVPLDGKLKPTDSDPLPFVAHATRDSITVQFLPAPEKTVGDQSNPNAGVIAGAVVGPVVGAVAIGAVAKILYNKRKQKTATSTSPPSPHIGRAPSSSPLNA